MKSITFFNLRAILFGLFLFLFTNSNAQIAWKPIGPWGGNVEAIAGDSSVLLAPVLVSNGNQTIMYRSTDGGQNWLPNTQVLDIPNYGRKFYKLGNRFYLTSIGGANSSSMVSLDSGKTFQPCQGSPYYSPVVLTQNGKYLGFSSYTSIDGFDFVSDNSINPYRNIVGQIGSRLYAISQNRDSLFQSDDDNFSWNLLSAKEVNYFYGLFISSLPFGRPYLFSLGNNILFINTASNLIPGQTGPLLRSLDGGVNWQSVSTGLPLSAASANPYCHIGNVLFTSNSSGIFRSSDLGETWEGINTPVPGDQIKCMYAWKNRLLIGTQHSGIFKSDNLGDDWSNSSFGLMAQPKIGALAVKGNKLVGMNCQISSYGFSSIDNGQNWEQFGISTGYGCVSPGAYSVKALDFYGDTVVGSTLNSTFTSAQSSDLGQTFTPMPSWNDPGENHGLWVYQKALFKLVSFNEAGNQVKTALVKTINFGLSWDTVAQLTGVYIYINHVFTFNKNRAFLIFKANTGTTGYGLKTTNGGATWQTLTLPNAVGNSTIQIKDMACKGDSIFLLTTDFTTPAYRSYNGGQTWTSLFQVGAASGYQPAQVEHENGILYLTAQNGIYRSSNWGGTWSNMVGNFPIATNNNFLDLQIKGDSLLVSHENTGIWFTPICNAIAQSPTLTPCGGGVIQLVASGGINYAWTGPNNFTSTSQNPLIQNITTVNSGIYTVTVNTPGGCSIQKTVNITVQPGAGNLTLTANTVCAGQTLNLNVIGGNGTYQWTGPRGFTSPLQNPTRDTLTAADSGFYSVKVTAANGCISTKSVYVAVPYLPRANQVPIANLNPCNKDTVLLQAAYKIVGVGYQWFRNNTILIGAINPTYKATLSGKYHFVYTKGTCRSLYADTIQITFSNFVQPRKPILSVSPAPTSCLQQFTINSTANGNYIRKWFKNGIEIPGANSVNYTTDKLATYQLQVDTGNTCKSVSAPFTVSLEGVQAFTSPQIHVATIRTIPPNDTTLRCAIEWIRNDPPNTNIQRVIILKQGSVANQFDSIGTVGNGINDTAFVDLNSNPQIQPYFYKIQARAICPSGGTYLTAPSPLHKTIHLQISKAPTGNIYNLLWTAYEGFTVSSYKIYRGLSASTANFLLTTVAGNITAYTDAPPTNEVYFYRVEAATTDVYFPWGRINAIPPRVSKSNIKSITQRIPDEQSIFQEVVPVLPSIENPLDNFTVYPNPYNQTFFIKGGKAGQKYKAMLRDIMGREISSWSFVGSENPELQNQAPKGLYWLEIIGEGYKGGVRLLKE